jgi:hypothetical protein
MTAIWHNDPAGWRLLSPAGFPDERTLHDLVEQAPHVLPLAGSPLLVIVGREVRLGNGYADLLAIETTGRLCVIEVKLASNGEARRAVVAQVLAYAAYLHGLTIEEVERDVLGPRLRDRGHESLIGALTATDENDSLDPEDVTRALAENLGSGAFRLVLVLDQAPSELVHLVGYLEAMTEKLVIDLITVSRYDVAGQEVMVPQRVDPERVSSESSKPARASVQGQTSEGVDAFELLIETAPLDARPQLRRLAGWAQRLQEEGLARVVTSLKPGWDRLLPLLPAEGVGLVTIWCDKSGGHVQFWRSVFERLAPNSLPLVEAAAAPALVTGGGNTRIVSDDLLDALTAAYREAAAAGLARSVPSEGRAPAAYEQTTPMPSS